MGRTVWLTVSTRRMEMKMLGHCSALLLEISRWFVVMVESLLRYLGVMVERLLICQGVSRVRGGVVRESVCKEYGQCIRQ